MKTDYQNLNLFDASTVIFAAIGIGLIGVVAFSQLPAAPQQKIAQAVAILDLNEQSVEVAQGLNFVFELPTDYLNQFYIAFAEVAVIPEDAVTPPAFVADIFDGVANYSDQISANFQTQYASAAAIAALPNTGEVLGAMIDLSPNYNSSAVPAIVKAPCSPPLAAEQVRIPYTFVAPDFDSIQDSWKHFNLIFNN